MPIISIGINNDVEGVNSYTLYMTDCPDCNDCPGTNTPVLIASNLSFSDFPYTVITENFGINGPCWYYSIEGDPACDCSGMNISPTPTPTISVTPSITPTISVTPSITPTISVTPSITPSITPTISVTPSITPSITTTPTSSITPSITPSMTPSQTGCVEFVLEWSFVDTDACSGIDLQTNTYYTSLPFTVGNTLYQNDDCSTAVTAGRYVIYEGSVYYINNGTIENYTC